MTFGEKLKIARKDKKMSQDELASKMGVNRVAVSNYEQNKNTPTLSNLAKIISILSLPDDYFTSNETSKIRTIPLIGLASCGVPQEYDLNGYDHVPISENIYEEGMYAVKAEGSSMSPKINNNDILYCNVNRQIENGDIVHYSLSGESGIKRYKINEKGDIISLVPINSDYDIITIKAYDNVYLKMAKVVGSVDLNY